jgi:sulfofructosephosphate aldolase
MPVSDLATPAGVFTMLALDHRDALRNAFLRAGVDEVTPETVLFVKERIVAALGGDASAILLDHETARRCRPRDRALLVPLEAQGHVPLDGARLTTLEFDAAAARAVDADACKLLLYYRADHRAAAHQRELAARAAADCHAHGLPLVLEPLVYRLDGESEERYAAAFADLVAAAARELAETGVDLLKLQYPGDATGCERLTAAAAPLRWALLGGSDVDGETFAGQLEVACGAGAAGFIAGRAIWAGVLGLAGDEQNAWLKREARPLFRRLVGVAGDCAGR